MVWVVGGVLGLEVSPFRLSKVVRKGKFLMLVKEARVA